MVTTYDAVNCPRADFFVAASSETGVDFRTLLAGSELVVETAHSVYRLIVLNSELGRAVIQGGELFPDETEVRIEGSTVGGSELKVGWIGVGLQLEFSVWGRRGLTSPVRAITVETLHAI